MFYVIIFQRFWTFVLYNYTLQLQGKRSENGHFCQKCQSLRLKKWHFEWPNQNSKTTFIVQTFPKYGLYDFYFPL